MADFKAANLWLKLALWMVTMSMFLHLYSLAITGSFGSSGVTTSCLIAGFVFMLVAMVLVQGLVFLNELNGNKIALICLIIFALLGGILFGVGLAYNAYGYKHSNRYSTNVMGWACLTGLLGGIFAILEIAGVKA